jgi:hypothetical protein
MTEPENLSDYAHVKDGLVVNVSVWDGVQTYQPSDGVTMVPLPYTADEDGERRYTAGIGWDYVDGQFIDNRPQEPDDL